MEANHLNLFQINNFDLEHYLISFENWLSHISFELNLKDTSLFK